MFSIGEFSKMTGLTVKTLRFYHDQGILEPSHVESGSGYRFYAPAKVETARVIATGGFAALLAPHSKTIEEVDEFLTLTGLRLIQARNQETS